MTTTQGRIRTSRFRPAWWLAGAHLQTIWPSLLPVDRRRPAYRREILTLPDGDETAVDWADSPQAGDDKPLLLLLHGLESSSDSAYARLMMSTAIDAGWDGCVMNFRDCGDYRNRLPRRYHAGETGDVEFFLRQLRQQRKGPILAVGYSLGGNVLLKYLGETGARSGLAAAVAVCVPLDLQACSTRLQTGISRIYQAYMMRNMKKALRRRFTPETDAIDWDRAIRAETFDEFDDAVTAPLHGFAGKDDYYARCSSIRFLTSIETPTLILNARDDPFMSSDMLPTEAGLAPAVTLELAEHGGHVGFIDGGTPWRPRYFIPGRVMEYLRPYARATD